VSRLLLDHEVYVITYDVDGRPFHEARINAFQVLYMEFRGTNQIGPEMAAKGEAMLARNLAERRRDYRWAGIALWHLRRGLDIPPITFGRSINIRKGQLDTGSKAQAFTAAFRTGWDGVTGLEGAQMFNLAKTNGITGALSKLHAAGVLMRLTEHR
jgi:hypothetical protein